MSLASPKRLQMLSDDWLESGRSAVLRAPSVIVSDEFNYLVNPLHPNFSNLGVHDRRSSDSQEADRARRRHT